MRHQHPELDWDNAMSLCLRCGWWGQRDDFAAHKNTDEHRVADADEIQL